MSSSSTSECLESAGNAAPVKGGGRGSTSSQLKEPARPLPYTRLTLASLARPSPLCSYKAEFDEAGKHNELLAANLSKVVDDLHPVRVLQLFSAIPEEVRPVGLAHQMQAGLSGLQLQQANMTPSENCFPLLLNCSHVCAQDCELLDLAGRPEDLLMTHLPVPPVCIRPRWAGLRGRGASCNRRPTVVSHRGLERNRRAANPIALGP